MYKVKTVYADRLDVLNAVINAALVGLDLVDIKYQATQWGEYDARYTALIIYRECS